MNKKLLGALKAKNRYALTLPYNLNWGIQLTPDIRQYLSENPLVIADIGCRGGVTDELEPFVPYSKLFAFDADQNECDRLNKATHSHIERKIFPYFVGGKNGVTKFNLFTNPAESSVFDPDERYRQLFRSGNDFAVEKSVEIEARTLDSIFEAEQLAPAQLSRMNSPP